MPKFGLNWYVESIGFLLGVLLAYHEEKINHFFQTHTIRKLCFFLPISIAIKHIYFDTTLNEVYFLGNYILRMITDLLIITSILLLLSHFTLGNKVSKYLGKLSFDIFLYHGVFLEYFQFHDWGWNSNTMILSTIVCTLIFVVLFNPLEQEIVHFAQNKIFNKKP